MTDEQRAHDRSRLRVYGVSTLSAILALSTSLIISNRTTNESERKFCAVVSTSVRTTQERLAGYFREPPTTPSGREQQATAEATLVQLLDLQRRLDCPARKD